MSLTSKQFALWNWKQNKCRIMYEEKHVQKAVRSFRDLQKKKLDTMKGEEASEAMFSVMDDIDKIFGFKEPEEKMICLACNKNTIPFGASACWQCKTKKKPRELKGGVFLIT